jgi:hypothetical protein
MHDMDYGWFRLSQGPLAWMSLFFFINTTGSGSCRRHRRRRWGPALHMCERGRLNIQADMERFHAYGRVAVSPPSLVAIAGS